MAAVTVANCTKISQVIGSYEFITLKSPATMDSADTIDVTAIMNGKAIVSVNACDATTGDMVTTTFDPSTDVVTVDASGGTTNHTYYLNLVLANVTPSK